MLEYRETFKMNKLLRYRGNRYEIFLKTNIKTNFSKLPAVYRHLWIYTKTIYTIVENHNRGN